MATRKKTGGRARGVPNKSTAEVRELAQQYGEEALVALASVMRQSKNDQARIAAAKELLDRGYGKSSQAIAVAAAITSPKEQHEISATPAEYEAILRQVLSEY